MKSMLRRGARAGLLLLILAVMAGSLAAHELFLKLTTYFLPPNTPVQALLLNGTFTRSENAVARARIADFSLVGPSGKQTLDTTAIMPRGDSTQVRFQTAGVGTYVAGISIKPSQISLTGAQFNGYLKEEGIEETLAERTRSGTLGEAAREQYAKHVKAIFQVGDARNDSYATVLGYPAEIVPVRNPYAVKPGESLEFRCLVQGQPTAGLTVIAGGLTPRGAAIPETRATTNADGLASIRLSSPGRWYVKFIRMARSTQAGLTHESQWATLTFEVR